MSASLVRASSLDHLIITEIQTQSAASASDEFIEIYNPLEHDISLAGFELQYLSATGSTPINMMLTPVVGSSSLSAHSFMLFTSTVSPLSGDAQFAARLSGAGGRVLIKIGGVVHDSVGWGSATQAVLAEGAPALAPEQTGNTISRLLEVNGSFQDTNSNVADFYETAPSPQGGGLVEVAVDVCPNISGAQEVVPPGFIINDLGQCVEIIQDICPNIPDVQTVLPERYERDSKGNCYLAQECLVQISEISAQPYTDGSEFIELVNYSNQPAWLTYCSISINGGTLKVLPSEVLQPSSYFVLRFASGAIRNSSGRVELINSRDEHFVYSYQTTKAGESVNYSKDQLVGLTTTIPTPGTLNIFPSDTEDTEAKDEAAQTASLAECPEGKYRNPATNRCKAIESAAATLAPCAADQVRSPETNRCRKIATASATLTPCAADQERNPATNRCRKIVSSSSTLKPCEPGQERNAATNRCRKVTSSSIGSSLEKSAQNTTSADAFKYKTPLIGLLMTGLVGYGAYEYRSDIQNAARTLRSRRQKGRPPG
jgi:hypothetical protein